MLSRLPLATFVAILIFDFVPSAMAQMGAQVRVPMGRLFEFPDSSSKVVSEVPKGTLLQGAPTSVKKKSWHRLKVLKDGLEGWMRSADIRWVSLPGIQTTPQVQAAPTPQILPPQEIAPIREPQPETAPAPKLISPESKSTEGLPSYELKPAFVISGGYHALASTYYFQAGYRFDSLWSASLYTSSASKTAADYLASGQIWGLAVRVTPVRTAAYRLGLQIAGGTIPELAVKLSSSTVYYSPSVFVTEIFHQLVLSDLVSLRFGLGYRYIQPIEAKSASTRVETRMGSTFVLLGLDLEI